MSIAVVPVEHVCGTTDSLRNPTSATCHRACNSPSAIRNVQI
jgi:hypothetical protein